MNFYKKLTKNKSIEIETIWEKPFSDYFSFWIRWNKRADHAGFEILFALFNFNFSFNIYDGRHWNYDEDRYYLPGEEQAEAERELEEERKEMSL
jgi:hypothetical protein